MNIYQRIAQVQKAVSKVAKDTTVQAGGQSYKAVSHDAVLSVIRDAVIEAGIVISPTQVGKGDVIPGETKSGSYKHRFEAVYRIDFINIENPEDRHSVEVEAHADDNGDKAPGKAISYATKTAELKVFMLATGENDEERMEDGHYGRRPQGKTPSPDREGINQRIRQALANIGCKTKEDAENKVEDLTGFYSKRDQKQVPGKKDYRSLSDKQAEILVETLEKLAADKRAEPAICNECRQPLSGGVCPNCAPM